MSRRIEGTPDARRHALPPESDDDNFMGNDEFPEEDDDLSLHGLDDEPDLDVPSHSRYSTGMNMCVVSTSAPKISP